LSRSRSSCRIHTISGRVLHSKRPESVTAVPQMPSSASPVTALPRAAVSGAIFRGDEVLLTQRGQAPMLGAWSLPGGHIEPGEKAADALLRELREETAIEARLLGVADVVDVIRRGEDAAVSFHRVILVFYGIWLDGEARAGSDAAAVMWRRPSEMAALRTTPGLAEVVERAESRLRQDGLPV
jgi:8-oxo-dGTP diphosphatase